MNDGLQVSIMSMADCKKNYTTLLSCIYQLQQSYAACAHISFCNPRSQHLGSILSRENTTWEIWKNMGNQHPHI